MHSKWLYVWSALETFDKAEFKLLKCIRDEFINSNFHLHSEKAPGYLEVSGRHCEILRSPFPTAGVGLIPESERGKICISNKDITSELSYSIYCSVFPPSIAQQTTPRIRWELSWDWPSLSPCPGDSYHPVLSFLRHTDNQSSLQTTCWAMGAHSKPQHGQSCAAAGEAELPASLPFYQSPTGHFHAAFCTHLHSAQLTMCDIPGHIP